VSYLHRSFLCLCVSVVVYAVKLTTEPQSHRENINLGHDLNSACR